MAERSIKKNFIFNLLYQIVIIIAPIITTPYVSRVLGVEGVGLYSYTNSIVTYFVIVATLGTTTFAQRKISYIQSDKEETSRAFWEMFILRIVLSAVTLSVYLIIFTVIFKENYIIYLILALNIINVVFDISWFFQGLEEFGKTAVRNIIFKIISIALIFLLVKTPEDLPLYILLIVGFVVLGSISLWLYMPKYLCRVRGINPFRDIKGVLLLFIPTVAIQIYTVLDKSMIGWFAEGSAENGYYEQAEKLIKFTLTVVVAFGGVVTPRIAKKFAENDGESVKNYIYGVYRVVWLLSLPLMAGWIVISDFVVPVFLGEGYEKCIQLIPIFSMLTVFIGINTTTNSVYLVPTNRHNVFTIIVVVGAVINFILNLILIPFHYSLGATISSVIAEFCVMAVGLIYICKKKLFSLKPIFKSAVKYFIASAVMLAALFAIKYFLSVTVWGLILLIVAGVLIYGICLLILRDKLVFDVLKGIFAKLKRNKEDNE